MQSKIKTTKKNTAEDILQQTKFGVKDKSGKVFKYMSYGNNHHAEIIQNIETGKIKAEFVTMMEASNRVKGINMPKQPIIKTDYALTPNLVCCKISSAVFFLVVFIFDCKTLTRLIGFLPNFKVFKFSSLNASLLLP
jgi:hypothetical protein